VLGPEHLKLFRVVDDCRGIDHAEPETSAAAGAHPIGPLRKISCEGEHLPRVSDRWSGTVANEASAPLTVEKCDTEAPFEFGEPL
jgi:hypothetical protein